VPEYLAPGVYIEEVSFRNKPIDGVSTSTAGFVGPARFGPVGSTSCVITSLKEFERTYGDGGQLVFSDFGQMHNFLWHAVRALEPGAQAAAMTELRAQAGTPFLGN